MAAVSGIDAPASAQGDFPIIDWGRLEKDPQATATEVFNAASQWGFLVIRNHGIPQKDVDRMFELSAHFFRQPKRVKEEKMMNKTHQGYNSSESELAVQEGVSFGSVADSNMACSNYSSWWTVERRREVEAFRWKCWAVAEKLLQTFATAMGLRPSYFVDAHSPHKEPGNNLRLIHYPARDERPDDKFPRLAEHTDWGSLTMLFAKMPGLEVRRPGDKGWVAAPVMDDACVVNVADGLGLWTGQTLKSTLHRVSWEGLPYHMHRHSVVYFVNANADAPLKTLVKTAEGSFEEKTLPFAASFGDYQRARTTLISRYFNEQKADEDEILDAKLVEMVTILGIAHGAGYTSKDE